MFQTTLQWLSCFQ